MKKKLLLINPVVKNTNCTFNEPLALGIIAAMSIDKFHVELIDENYEEFQFVDADLVAMTATTFSINRAIHISKEYAKKNIPVIIGGVHVSSCPEAHFNYFTSIVKGNAENLWGLVVEDFEKNELKKMYVSRTSTKVFFPPYRDLFLKYNYPASSIETSRGCPNNCDFCCVNSFHDNIYYEKSTSVIIDEIKKLKNKTVFFVDDNFVGNLRNTERIEILIKELIPLKIKWYAFSTMNIANHPKLLKLFKESGCVMLFIGFETTDMSTLKSINKKINIPNNDRICFNDSVKLINKAGIGVMGGFIYGFDKESIEEVKKRRDEVLKSKINWFSISILTPLPGSPLFKRMIKEDRILKKNFPEDWALYNFCNTIHKPDKILPEDLDQFFKESFSFCYNKKNTLKRLLKTLFSLKSLSQTYFFFLWVTNHYMHIRDYTYISHFMKCGKRIYSK